MFVRKTAIISAFSLLSLSCALIWLGGLDLEIYPSEPEQIFGAEDTISVVFSEEVDRFSFESIFRLAGPGGDAEGDFIWKDGSVVFEPLEKMQPGFRYRLTISGELKTADGKSFSKYMDVPFYYKTDAAPPLLVSASPANAETVGIDRGLTFVFSKAIDRKSFDDGFSLNPAADFSCEWNKASTSVTIAPDEAWTNLKYYSWALGTDIIDLEGVPLPEAAAGSFLVQLDISAPAVVGVYPASGNGDGSYSVLTALGPDDLLFGQHLAISFSEDIDFASLRQELSFDPSIDGYIAALGPSTALYYISEDLPPAGDYKLTIGEGLADPGGNATTEDWVLLFTPDIPAQQIESVVIEDSVAPDLSLGPEDFNEENFITVPGLDYYGTDTLYFYVNLSEGIPLESINERLEFVSGISLSAVFPAGTAAPALASSDWASDTKIRLIYEGLVSCSAEGPVYYRFKITAGSSDTAAPNGAYLLEGVSFIFLAEAE